MIGAFLIVALSASAAAAAPPPRIVAVGDVHGDLPALKAATREWLAVAHDLLAERSFPPSPSADDCAFCPFRVTCDGTERAAAAVDDAAGAVETFFALKVEPEEEP